MITLLYVALGLQGLDFYTTYKGISSGKAKEANPVMLWIFKKLGIFGGLAVTKVFAVAMCIAIYSSYPFFLLPLIALYAYIVYNNFKIIK